MPNPNIITIPITANVNAWTALLGPGGPAPGITLSTFNLSLPANNPNGPNNRPYVSLESDGNGGQNIIVRGNVQLKFTFPQVSVDDPTLSRFYPVGLSYYCENDGKHGATDIGSLPRNSIQYGTDPGNSNNPGAPYVIVNDTWGRTGRAANKAAWKYYLVIQDNYGSIGVIDPDIENDTDPA